MVLCLLWDLVVLLFWGFFVNNVFMQLITAIFGTWHESLCLVMPLFISPPWPDLLVFSGAALLANSADR